MIYTKNLILVCAGRDAVRAAEQGLPALHLCLRLTESGALERIQAPTAQVRSLLGLCGPSAVPPACNADRLAADLAYEARRISAPGVFADFEAGLAGGGMLLSAFDQVLHEEGIPFYVPLESGRALPHAVLTVSTALSGGSLTAYIASLQEEYGVSRIAAFLQPVSQDFMLPSASPRGRELTEYDRTALLQKTGAQAFFSRELCARYFTYTDEEGRAHFVMFDDASTLEAKLMQLSSLKVPAVFALFPDAAPLLNLS